MPTDLGPLLQEVAQRASTERTRVEVELESPVTLPLRPIAIRRCLTNLVQNAVRYASWVGVRVAAQGDHVWIAIDDDGPGIPPDQREAVFKAFYRLDRLAQPEHRRGRARPDHRARHRARPWRRHRAPGRAGRRACACSCGCRS